MAGQLWAIDILGGFMYSDELSETLRVELLPSVKFRQFCDAQDATEKGLNKGEDYNWNVYSRVANKGRAIDEDEKMPETRYTITQQSLTVTEYGNSVPYTGKLNNMSKQPVTDLIQKVLKIDAKETLDSAAHAQFNNTPLRAFPVGGTSTSAIVLSEDSGVSGSTTNNVALGKGHVRAIVLEMKERNIPPYANDDYYAIAWPSTYQTFKDDLEAISLYVETGFRHIMNGEIGRYEGTRFIEQTNVPKGGALDSTTWNSETADAWDNGESDWAFFFGSDTVAEAIVIPEEIRGKIPTDMGRSRGIGWYYLGGFGIVHGPNGDAANARIVKWDSAA